MNKILYVGSFYSLRCTMRELNAELKSIEILEHYEEMATFIAYENYSTYLYKVIYQVYEKDENELPSAINIVKIECELQYD